MKESLDGSEASPALRAPEIGVLALDYIAKRDAARALRIERRNIRERYGCANPTDSGVKTLCFEEYTTPPEYESWCEGCRLAGSVTVKYQSASHRAGAALAKLTRACRLSLAATRRGEASEPHPDPVTSKLPPPVTSKLPTTPEGKP